MPQTGLAITNLANILIPHIPGLNLIEVHFLDIREGPSILDMNTFKRLILFAPQAQYPLAIYLDIYVDDISSMAKLLGEKDAFQVNLDALQEMLTEELL